MFKFKHSTLLIFQIPDLVNQLLLINLQLNDNSITGLSEMKTYWMPLLNKLEINQNCIEEIQLLTGLFNIETIEFENNNLCEIESINAIKDFNFLNEIRLTNNPIINEEKIEIENYNLSNELIDSKSCLKLTRTSTKQDGNDTTEQFYHKSLKKIYKFVELHKNQINAYIEQYQNFNQLNEQMVLASLEQLMNEFNVLRDVVIKLRFIFEINDIGSLLNIDYHLNGGSNGGGVGGPTKVPSRPTSARQNDKNRVYSARLERIKGLRSSKTNTSLTSNSVEIDELLNVTASINGFSKKVEESSLSSNQLYINKLIEKHTLKQLNKSATRIQARWKGYRTRKEMDRQAANMAATIIQARWRGYIIRKRIEEARKRINEENQFEFEEIDLKEFEFDESKFDVKIPMGSVPYKQFIHAALDANMFSKPPRPPSVNHNLPPVIGVPKRAWKGETPRTNSAASTHENYDIKPTQVHPLMFTGRSLNSASTNPDSEAMPLYSMKHENIANEWGFKDHRTAMLMLQRADKMKYKVERKNKLKSLDPKQRLKLLRKMDKFTPRVTGRNTSQNIQHSLNPINFELPLTSPSNNFIPQSHQNTNIRTYEWLHSQVRDMPSITSLSSKSNDFTKVPKLPQIPSNLNHANGNGNNAASLWRKSSSGSNSTLDQNPATLPLKTINLLGSNITSKQNSLPPLNNQNNSYGNSNHKPLNLNYDFNTSQQELEDYSIASSRSSFTNMFISKKPAKLGEIKKRNHKKKY